MAWSMSEGFMRSIWPVLKWLGFGLVVLLCVGVIYQQIGTMNGARAATKPDQTSSIQLFTS
jgi:hypothetical protein